MRELVNANDLKIDSKQTNKQTNEPGGSSSSSSIFSLFYLLVFGEPLSESCERSSKCVMVANAFEMELVTHFAQWVGQDGK